MKKIILIPFNELEINQLKGFLIAETDLVLVRYGDSKISLFYGRCLHRGALLQDGKIAGNNLICPVHNWDYRVDTGISEYNNSERLPQFKVWVEAGQVCADEDEIGAWTKQHPQPFNREEYLGQYADTSPIASENKNAEIQHLAKYGLEKWGHHGPIKSMGVPRTELPRWDNIQVLTAQLHRLPKLDNDPVATEVIIGPNAKKPLRLEIPLFVSDMSFGALSQEAKVSLAKGAEMAGTGICSGEGGMLPEEKVENSRYFYELASAEFGFHEALLETVQAFHFKCGQGAKTGTGGHLPGNKVQGKIAKVRGLKPGTDAISPARFRELDSVEAFREMADKVRQVSEGIPVGFKLSAQQVEKDIDFALQAGADYIILDGRGGGTGAAPTLFRDHISVPTIPALARARRYLDSKDAKHVSLIITGGLRTAPDFIKAIALGADAIALSNSVMQAIGCIAMRACSSNACPVGIATQQDYLRKRLEIAKSATRLKNFFLASTDLMKVITRACGYDHINQLQLEDLSTFDEQMHKLAGIPWAGIR